MDKLQFDKMEVNTDLAKKYFKKNNHQFKNESGSNLQSEEDRCSNTIFYTDSSKIGCQANFRNSLTQDLTNELEHKFRRLAEEVEKYAETFCQIEYMIRKIPVEEVRDYDIKLILQYLSLGFRARTLTCSYNIWMDETAPLFTLGLVVQALKTFESVKIIATRNTAAVCHFFAELCHNVGLDSVETYFERGPFPVSDTGCIGVVTERSDVDSAVDTFVRTTTRYPWRLSLVLVQESVLDAFSAAVARAAGAALVPTDSSPPATGASPPATGASPPATGASPPATGATPPAAGDALSLAAPGAAPVPTDAYRTTKELLAQLQEHRATYLSLWASDVSTANEIAYNVPSSVVWINGYGIFDGPPQTSQAIYETNLIYPHHGHLYHEKCSVASRDGLLQRQKAWANLTFVERRKIVLNVTDNFFVNLLNDEHKKFFESLRSALRDLESGNFVDVDGDRICVGLSVPYKVLLCEHLRTVEDLATLLTMGSAIIYQENWLNRYLAESASGIPVTLINEYLNQLASRIPMTLRSSGIEVIEAFSAPRSDNYADLLKTKIVWTSFGTIFAN